MRLHILIPSRDTVHVDFMLSLINMLTHIFQNPPDDDFGISLSNERGALIHMTRERMVTQALLKGATHVLFLDSDMTFPADSFHRLLDDDKDVVAASYVQRATPTASNTVALDRTTKVHTTDDSTGLEKVSSTGLGLCLFKIEAFKDTPRPWFDTYWTEMDGNYTMIGEDVFLFLKLAHHGHELYIDHDLSKEVGHLGQFEYIYKHSMINEEANEGDRQDRPDIVV